MAHEEFAHAVATFLSDSTNPFNRLKRPAKRVCVECGETYKSAVSLLADSGRCADCIEVPTYIQKGITPEQALLRAILGVE
jgi:hypothetical protein